MKALLALFIFVFALAANAAPASILSNVEFQSDHTLAVDIPDSQIITHVGKEGMAPLFQRFMDHYGQFIDPENPRELDFEFVMGFKNYETARQLEHLFYLALNEGQDMSAFKVFGIEVNGRTIKYSSLGHKIFRSSSDIFRSIAMASAPEHYKKYMTRIGLKMVDIIQIIQYCDNYGGNVMIDKLGKANLTYLETITSKLLYTIKHKKQLSEKEYRLTLMRPSYVTKFISEQIWRNWGLELLQQLEPQAQKALISYLPIDPGGISSTQSMHSKTYIQRIEQKLKSGRWKLDINAALRSYPAREIRL
jgi:hypothetical protein